MTEPFSGQSGLETDGPNPVAAQSVDVATPLAGHAVEFGSRPVTTAAIAAIARSGATVTFTSECQAAMARSHETLLRLAQSGEKIYGVTTGLGAAVDTAVSADDSGFQRRIPLARAVGVGPIATSEQVRAMMAARLARFAQGVSGTSLTTILALRELINAQIHPVVPLIGSIGQADLPPLSHIAAALIGEGNVFIGTFSDTSRGITTMTAAEGLRSVELQPARLAPKDGLSLLSSNAGSVGLAALAIEDCRQVISTLISSVALSFEGFRASIAPLQPNVTALRPVPGQHEVAQSILNLLAGGQLTAPHAARRLQDPLSFRNTAVVLGAALHALNQATAIVNLELNSSDDNPAISPPTLSAEGASLPNANFDATHLTLAFEGLGLALARVAAITGERIMKLLSPALSDLPRFLSPVQNGSAGFAPVQKTVTALVAEVQFRANPYPAVTVPVADRVEDYASLAFPVVLKTDEIIVRLRFLAAIELLVAAQACDLQTEIELGNGTAAIRRTVRSMAPMLEEDRSLAADIAAISQAIGNDQFVVDEAD
jgi:histidine ammonia-lyase